MKLTSKLREKYISDALTEANRYVGMVLPRALFYYYSYEPEADKVEVPIVMRYIIPDNGSYIYLDRKYYYKDQTMYELHCGGNHNNMILLIDSVFDRLYNLTEGNYKLKAIEEWNDLIKIKYDLKNKKKETKSNCRKMQLDFDGTITLNEIKKKFKSDYYIRVLKTKITFHRSWINSKNKLTYFTTPDFEIRIKPVIKGNADCDVVYNRTEYENELKRIESEY